jgi:uncharacterized protein YqjF (DUF2071 family)
MTSNKQLQMVMRDMLFITWAVEPDVVRKLVDQRLELDTKTDSSGREVAFLSAVSFQVTEVRSGMLPLSNLSFQQVNYRAYVRAGEVPAICFLDMRVNSRMITTLTSFMSVPVYYEEIDITTSPGAAGVLSYRIQSAGLRAEAMIDHNDVVPVSDGEIAPQFITHRLVGYAGAGGGMFRIDAEQPALASISARVHNVQAPSLEGLGVLTPEQSARPLSALYVREGLFGADTPVREW